MADSLSEFHIVLVGAELPGRSRVMLMPTQLREFIADQSVAQP